MVKKLVYIITKKNDAVTDKRSGLNTPDQSVESSQRNG